MAGLEMIREDPVTRRRERRHHAIRADGDAAVDLAERDRGIPQRARAIGREGVAEGQGAAHNRYTGTGAGIGSVRAAEKVITG